MIIHILLLTTFAFKCSLGNPLQNSSDQSPSTLLIPVIFRSERMFRSYCSKGCVTCSPSNRCLTCSKGYFLITRHFLSSKDIENSYCITQARRLMNILNVCSLILIPLGLALILMIIAIWYISKQVDKMELEDREEYGDDFIDSTKVDSWLDMLTTSGLK